MYVTMGARPSWRKTSGVERRRGDNSLTVSMGFWEIFEAWL